MVFPPFFVDARIFAPYVEIYTILMRK